MSDPRTKYKVEYWTTVTKGDEPVLLRKEYCRRAITGDAIRFAQDNARDGESFKLFVDRSQSDD